MPSYYCPECPCENCARISSLLTAKQQRLDALQHARDAAAVQRGQARFDARREALREGAVIWMLINTARDVNQAQVIQQVIADAMQIRPGQVTAKRVNYVTELDRRTRKILGGVDAIPWAKLPGTRGTELPDNCEVCGGLKTEGRKCARRSCRKAR